MTFILLLASFLCAVAATVIGFGWIGSDPFDVAMWAGWISLAVALFVAAHLADTGLPDNIDLGRHRRRD